jgi:mannosyltransferase OCH1-like enzyme
MVRWHCKCNYSDGPSFHHLIDPILPQYADIDTEPLRQPTSWISSSDLASWADPITRFDYSFHDPVGMILGIEADCQPSRDDYWRMGYTYPVQLTQWALASKPGHAILQRFMDTLSQRLIDIASRNEGNITSPKAIKELQHIGPVSLTGPVAVTNATKNLLSEQVGLRWNSLSGLFDGGQSKLVRDVLILPITAFRYAPGDFWEPYN